MCVPCPAHCICLGKVPITNDVVLHIIYIFNSNVDVKDICLCVNFYGTVLYLHIFFIDVRCDCVTNTGMLPGKGTLYRGTQGLTSPVDALHNTYVNEHSSTFPSATYASTMKKHKCRKY